MVRVNNCLEKHKIFKFIYLKEKELIKAQVEEGEPQNKKEEILVKTDDHPTPTVEEVKPNEKPSLPEEKKEIFKRFV